MRQISAASFMLHHHWLFHQLFVQIPAGAETWPTPRHHSSASPTSPAGSDNVDSRECSCTSFLISSHCCLDSLRANLFVMNSQFLDVSLNSWKYFNAMLSTFNQLIVMLIKQEIEPSNKWRQDCKVHHLWKSERRLDVSHACSCGPNFPFSSSITPNRSPPRVIFMFEKWNKRFCSSSCSCGKKFNCVFCACCSLCSIFSSQRRWSVYLVKSLLVYMYWGYGWYRKLLSINKKPDHS